VQAQLDALTDYSSIRKIVYWSAANQSGYPRIETFFQTERPVPSYCFCESSLIVNAGSDQIITLPVNLVSLIGEVHSTDSVLISWSVLTGPGVVTFSNPLQRHTQAVFSRPGVYVLRLTAATDTQTVTDDVQIIVHESSILGNGDFNQTRFDACQQLNKSADFLQPSVCYQLSKSGHVKIEILNSKGEKILTLLDQQESQGQKSVQWNGRNESGEKVSSGVYSVVMEVDGEIFINKVVVIK
jgi:hypothetical protein